MYLSDVVRPNRRQVLSKDLKFQPNARSGVSPVAVSDIEECLLLLKSSSFCLRKIYNTNDQTRKDSPLDM